MTLTDDEGGAVCSQHKDGPGQPQGGCVNHLHCANNERPSNPGSCNTRFILETLTQTTLILDSLKWTMSDRHKGLIDIILYGYYLCLTFNRC